MSRPARSLARSKYTTHIVGLDVVSVARALVLRGAGGGLGIHQIMLSKWAGARVIAIDTAAEKFEACRKAGADEVVHAGRENVVDALRDLTRGKGWMSRSITCR